MPNGRPGDHPFTDIVLHNFDVFSPEIDDLVRKLSATAARDKVADLLWQQELWWSRIEQKPVADPSAQLQHLLNDLRTLEHSVM